MECGFNLCFLRASSTSQEVENVVPQSLDTSIGKPKGFSPLAADLCEAVEGQVLFPETEGFEKARTKVWNLDTAGKCLIIVQCISANDVSAAIRHAKQNKLPVCVHTAGAHSSHAVVDGCLVVDLSPMRSVAVDPDLRLVRVAGGAMIGDVDGACKPHGLALPMGHVHHTGVAGMALNATSGVGYLCRTRGLTATFLREVTMVMHDGSVRTVKEGDELFWGMGGAGANFGVAVEMVFALTKVAPMVFAGDLVKFPQNAGPGGSLFTCCDSGLSRQSLVLHWLSFFRDAPDECSSLLVLAGNGPIITRITYNPKEEDASLPEDEVVSKAQEVFEPLIRHGRALANSTKAICYWDGLQKLQEFDASYYYQKAANLYDIPDKLLSSIVDELCAQADLCPVTNMGSAIILMPLGGALGRMTDDEMPTAAVLSQAKWWCIVIAEFPKGQRDLETRQRCIEWVKQTHAIIEPYGSKDPGREKDYWYGGYGDLYGSNLPRLQKLKSKYDPENFFRWNRNVTPAPAEQ